MVEKPKTTEKPKYHNYLNGRFNGIQNIVTIHNFSELFKVDLMEIINQKVSQNSPKNISTKIVDIGGTGMINELDQLNKNFKNKLILSLNQINLIASNRDRINNIIADVRRSSIPLKNNSTDIIICSRTFPMYLDKMSEVFNFYKEILRVLKTDGQAIITPFSSYEFFERKDVIEQNRKVFGFLDGHEKNLVNLTQIATENYLQFILQMQEFFSIKSIPLGRDLISTILTKK